MGHPGNLTLLGPASSHRSPARAEHVVSAFHILLWKKNSTPPVSHWAAFRYKLFRLFRVFSQFIVRTRGNITVSGHGKPGMMPSLDIMQANTEMRK